MENRNFDLKNPLTGIESHEFDLEYRSRFKINYDNFL